MNAPRPALTSKTIASAPPAIFFETIELAISPVEGHRTGAIAQGVEQPVSRNEPSRLRGDGAADRFHLRDERCRLEIGADARDRLELVERSAGVAERATREFRDRNAAGGDERDRDQRDRVADAARGMFVDDPRAAFAQAGIGQHVAGTHHRLGQGCDLGEIHPADRHGHRQRRYRGIVNCPPNVALDNPRPRRAFQRPSVPLDLERPP